MIPLQDECRIMIERPLYSSMAQEDCNLLATLARQETVIAPQLLDAQTALLEEAQSQALL